MPCDRYVPSEQREGWRLWRVTAGEDRPFEQFLTEQQVCGGSDHVLILQQIDHFDNTWFPRTRAIIRRAIPADQREQFASAFFQNLEQQPLGPGVVGSVSTFIARVEGLSKAADPAAKAVRDMLARRGLTAGAILKVREMLATQ